MYEELVCYCKAVLPAERRWWSNLRVAERRRRCVAGVQKRLIKILRWETKWLSVSGAWRVEMSRLFAHQRKGDKGDEEGIYTD